MVSGQEANAEKIEVISITGFKVGDKVWWHQENSFRFGFDTNVAGKVLGKTEKRIKILVFRKQYRYENITAVELIPEVKYVHRRSLRVRKSLIEFVDQA